MNRVCSIVVTIIILYTIVLFCACEDDRICVEWENVPTSTYCTAWASRPISNGKIVVYTPHCTSHKPCCKCIAWRLKESTTEAPTKPENGCP